jgi:CubicO group peptidase (beta-lactamase class C family)
MMRSTIAAQLRLSWVMLSGAIAACAGSSAWAATQAPADAVRWSSIGPAVLAAAERERAAQGPASITIGIVDGNGLVWSGSTGYSDAQRSQVADEHTLYRAGSITKLFTDLVVMQYVERGTLDLDAPVQRYLPDFKPRNPYQQPITLRLLMSHRSGLIREPPLGHYFADQPVPLAQSVRSLNTTTLVAAPGTLTKYSNAGIAVVGRVLEVVSGKPYEQLVQEQLLEVLAMNESTLRESRDVRSRLAYAELAPFDAPRFVPPLFDLGMAPAGALYSSVSDLAKFAAALLNGGKAARGRILEQRTLERMWEPHTVQGAPRTFGIGFILDSLDGHRVVGHSGAIYGYVADLVVFPEDGFGVIIMVSLDEARHLMRRLRNYTARQAFALLGGPAAPEYVLSEAVPAAARKLAGHYLHGANSLDVRLLDGRVYVETSAFAAELRRLRNPDNGRYGWVIDDVTHYREDVDVDLVAGTITIGTDIYKRAPYPKPAPPSEELAGLIGEYGWDHNYVRIYERDGRPHVRIEWSTYETLERAEQDVYRFTDIRGMYPLEQLRFTRGRDGQGVSVSLNGIVFPRRDFGAQTEAKVKANARAIPQLRANALAAAPPAEQNKRSAQLVEVAQLDPSIRLDIRYASPKTPGGPATHLAV